MLNVGVNLDPPHGVGWDSGESRSEFSLSEFSSHDCRGKELII